MLGIQRREFITLLGGAAAWPLAGQTRAQTARIRRVGVLSFMDEGPAVRAEFAIFSNELARLGWTDGRNLRLDYRFAAGKADRIDAGAAELVKLEPDVIVANGSASARALQQRTRTIPIIAISVGGAAAGLIKNDAHPEGNFTGITNRFDSITNKWLELLKEAVPQLERVASVLNPQLGGNTNFAEIREAGPLLHVATTEISFRNVVELVHQIDDFAAGGNGGLIISPAASAYLETILISAAQHRLPTVVGLFAREGALIGYEPLDAELFQRGAFFVDRILRGAKPGDLPFEYPTRFELVVNLKTAKAIAITIPESFLVRADEVIE
jgi:putative ABC transport system substrate-binding protein